MHRYQPLWPQDRTDWDPPSPADFTFRDALDVGRFVALDAFATWGTCPDVWHLDETGRWRCCSRGSSFDSVHTFAEEPDDMLACRLTTLDWECPDYWVMVEPRRQWLAGDEYDVTEADAAAFLRLRAELGQRGVTLLDVVVFHEDHTWWSLHELTSGTTAWSFDPPPVPAWKPRPPRRRRRAVKGGSLPDDS